MVQCVISGAFHKCNGIQLLCIVLAFLLIKMKVELLQWFPRDVLFARLLQTLDRIMIGHVHLHISISLFNHDLASANVVLDPLKRQRVTLVTTSRN